MNRCNVHVSLLFVLSILCLSTTTLFADEYDPQKTAAERIQRQLSLANKMKAERLEREGKKAKRVQQEEKLGLYCGKASDSLRQYEQARLRWYALDDNGDRVYLTEKQLDAKKAQLRKDIAEHCQ